MTEWRATDGSDMAATGVAPSRWRGEVHLPLGGAVRVVLAAVLLYDARAGGLAFATARYRQAVDAVQSLSSQDLPEGMTPDATRTVCEDQGDACLRSSAPPGASIDALRVTLQGRGITLGPTQCGTDVEPPGCQATMITPLRGVQVHATDSTAGLADPRPLGYTAVTLRATPGWGCPEGPDEETPTPAATMRASFVDQGVLPPGWAGAVPCTVAKPVGCQQFSGKLTVDGDVASAATALARQLADAGWRLTDVGPRRGDGTGRYLVMAMLVDGAGRRSLVAMLRPDGARVRVSLTLGG